jgi:hypothetical protein
LTAAILACGMATAYAAGDVQITTPNLGVPLAPGVAVAIPIRFHNIDTQPSDVDEVDLSFYGTDTPWPVTVSGPSGCGPISSDGYSYPMVSLPAGGTLDCVFTVTRPVGSVDDAVLDVWTSVDFNLRAVRIGLGRLADIALTNELVSYSVDPDGTTHGIFRVIARNVGSTPVGEFDAATCAGPTFDNAIQGGCAPTTSQCARGMVPYPAQGAHLPALAPGEQTSCLISVRGTTQSPQLGVLTLDQEPDWDVWLIDMTAGHDVYDPYQANNQTTLMAPAPGGGSGAQAAPTLSPFALALLGAGMLFVAAWASRRHGRRRLP